MKKRRLLTRCAHVTVSYTLIKNCTITDDRRRDRPPIERSAMVISLAEAIR